ncbi:MAG: ABC transporter permease [Phycisphaerales bacterium]
MSDTPGTSARWNLRRALENWGALLALALLVAFSAWRSDDFLKAENLLNILLNVSFVGIIAVGMTLVIIMGGIDLSVGSMTAFIGGMTILALNKFWNATHSQTIALLASVGTALCLGPLLGLLNGAMISFGRVAPFVATLGAMAAWRSASLAIADGGQYSARTSASYADAADTGVPAFRYFGQEGIPLPFLGEHAKLWWPIVIFLLVAAAGQVALSLTRYGRYVYAVGCNERAAVYSAINVRAVKLTTYVVIGLTCGIAALLRASQQESISSAQTGTLYELDAIAAVVIGGTSMAGGRGRVAGTVIGVLILGVVDNMLNLLQVSSYWQGAVKGAIIVAAVLLQRGRPGP